MVEPKHPARRLFDRLFEDLAVHAESVAETSSDVVHSAFAQLSNAPFSGETNYVCATASEINVSVRAVRRYDRLHLRSERLSVRIMCFGTEHGNPVSKSMTLVDAAVDGRVNRVTTHTPAVRRSSEKFNAMYEKICDLMLAREEERHRVKPIPTPPGISRALGAGLSVWSAKAPWQLFVVEAWHTTYQLTPETLERLDASPQRIVQQEWLPVLDAALHDRHTCAAHLLPYVKKVKIFFHPDELCQPSFMLPLTAWEGVHLCPIRTASLSSYLGIMENGLATLCHEIGHAVFYRAHGPSFDAAEGFHAMTHSFHNLQAGYTTPHLAYTEGFADFIERYGQSVAGDGGPQLPDANTVIIARMYEDGAYGVAPDVNFAQRSAREAFVASILLELALARPGNYHRILRAMKKTAARYDANLEQCLSAYLDLYSEQQELVQHIIRAHGLSPDEAMPAIFQP